MKAWLCIGLGALLAACSANSTSEPGDGDFTCEPGECVGTYLVTYTRISGSCAEPPAQLIRFDDSDEPDPDCVETAPTIVSEGGCKEEVQERCTDPDEPGYVADIVGVIEQADERCDTVVGTLTLRASNETTGQSCAGTYRVRGERQ